MRRRILHICAFCGGVVIGMAVSLLVALLLRFGMAHLPKVLSLLLRSKAIMPILDGWRLLPALGIFYGVFTLTPDTSNLRLNKRYAASAIGGAAMVSVLIAILVVLGHFGFGWGVRSEVRDALLEVAIFGVIITSICIARHFITEIDPGLGYCHHCGYDIRAIDSNQCPECGKPIIRSVSVGAVRTARDLVRLECSRFAILYLRQQEGALEEHAWLSFIRQMRANIDKFPDAEVYEVDVTQPLIKQWLESASQGRRIEPTDQVAFLAGGEILALDSTIMSSYYLRHGPHSLPGFKDTQVKPSSAPPAHFPNSFKKSTCIGRPSSLSFPYKH